MLQKINSIMREMGAVFVPETAPEWVIIEGDVNKVLEAFLAAKKPWMHMRKMDLDKDGKIKGIETDIKAEEPNQ